MADGAAEQGLTARERIVAEAAASGASNREIAEALVVSARTVEHHLTRVYRKLGVRSRGELVAQLSGARAVPPDMPETSYARSGAVNIAYQVLGDGPVDLVLVQGLVSHLEVLWEDPRYAAWVRDIASFTRLVLFDKRGTGMSDPIPVDSPPSLEQRMDDIRVVMDTIGSRRAVILGGSEGGPMSALFAATHPDRVAGLIMLGSWASRSEETRRTIMAVLPTMEQSWGRGDFLGRITPSGARTSAGRAYMARLERFSASPGTARMLMRLSLATDVRDVLPSVRVPTMVLHRTDDAGVPVAGAREVAEAIPGAQLVEQAGADHYPWYGDPDAMVAAIRRFVEALERPGPQAPSLHTVLAALHDPPDRWRDAVIASGGVLVASADGAVAVFDAPEAAVACALDLADRAGTGRVPLPGLGVAVAQGTLHHGRLSGPVASLARTVAGQAQDGRILLTRLAAELLPLGRFALTEAAEAAESQSQDSRTVEVLEVRRLAASTDPDGRS